MDALGFSGRARVTAKVSAASGGERNGKRARPGARQSFEQVALLPTEIGSTTEMRSGADVPAAFVAQTQTT